MFPRGAGRVRLLDGTQDPADVDAVRAIVRAAHDPYVARIGREPGPMLDDDRALIAAGRVTVTEWRRGVLVLIPEAEAMLLDDVAVDSSVRGTGLGGALIRRAERAAKETGRGSIRLHTDEAMAENIALYGRRGSGRVYRVKALGWGSRTGPSSPLPGPDSPADPGGTVPVAAARAGAGSPKPHPRRPPPCRARFTSSTCSASIPSPAIRWP